MQSISFLGWVYLYYVVGVAQMARWTTIKVPVELREMVKHLSEKMGKPQWQILTEAITFYEGFIRSPRVRTSTSNLDKLAWYITKLATSFGAFKENPSDENFEYLKKRVEELRERIGVEADLLLRVAEYYRSTTDESLRKKLRIDMNSIFKQIVKELIVQMMFELVSKEEAPQT